MSSSLTSSSSSSSLPTKLPTFPIQLSYQGKVIQIEDQITTQTTGYQLYEIVQQTYGWNDNHNNNKGLVGKDPSSQSKEQEELVEEEKEVERKEVKLLYKGKKLLPLHNVIVFPTIPKPNNNNNNNNNNNTKTKKFMKVPKIIVMATSSSTVRQVQTQKSDPLVRGFDQERNNQQHTTRTTYWGIRNGGGRQDRNYKFVRIESCTWQSFGHRPTDQTPHAFDAQRLLEQLATDPGIIAIMKERNLVVNTLGEMDPIDDRLMQMKQREPGSTLLGYNTNRGLRIDIKLRTEDLSSFRPYSDLVSTLIHELSHNWVSDHSIVFWTNYGQMKAHYFYHHYYHQSYKVNGNTTAELAGIGSLFDGIGGLGGNNKSRNSTVESPTTRIYSLIMNELKREMSNPKIMSEHQLHPNMIQGPIQLRCRELDEMYVNAMGTTGKRLGGTKVGGEVDGNGIGIGNGNGNSNSTTTSNIQNGNGMTARDKALAAAERRRHKQQEKET